MVARMRILISHETVYRYEEPARSVIQTLRLTPRNHEGQYVENWRIDLSENCQLDQHEAAALDEIGPFPHRRYVVLGGKRNKSVALGGKERVGRRHQRFGTGLDQTFNGGDEIVIVAGVADVKLQAERAAGGLHLLRFAFRTGVVWIDQNADGGRLGHHFMSQISS